MSNLCNHEQISSNGQSKIINENADRPKIKSSTFCKVLRIVAGLPAPVPKAFPKGKDRAPTRRPPVWAEVILLSLYYELLRADNGCSHARNCARHCLTTDHFSQVYICIKRLHTVICWKHFLPRKSIFSSFWYFIYCC